MEEWTYSKYSKEKILTSYSMAKGSLDSLLQKVDAVINNSLKGFELGVYRSSIELDFITFSEFIIHMCRAYLVYKKSPVADKLDSLESVDKAHHLGFFNDRTRIFLRRCVSLRNSYVHEYWKRGTYSEAVQSLCLKDLKRFSIFLDNVNLKIIANFSHEGEENNPKSETKRMGDFE